MRNLDIDANVKQALADALKGGEEESIVKAFSDFNDAVLKTVEQRFEAYETAGDMRALEQYGCRQLTSQETSWYQKFIEAAKSANPKQAITNLGDALPFTVIDRTLDDMRRQYPLLDELNVINAMGSRRIVMNAANLMSKLGSWGAIGSAITQEVAGAIKYLSLDDKKYTAYFLIPKDFVRFNFGYAPAWVDQYIRIILAAVIGNGLESAILTGDGNGNPVGMNRNINSVTSGVYAAKTATAITDFGDDYAAVIADMSIDGNGDYRTVPEVLLVVNPKDYIKKVRRWENCLTNVGMVNMIEYAYPTKVITSAFLTEGTAICGIAANYAVAINGSNSGIIEFSDENQFLEDNRVYTTRVYANGQPIDNTSFAVLNISGIESPAKPVKVTNTVRTTSN